MSGKGRFCDQTWPNAEGASVGIRRGEELSGTRGQHGPVGTHRTRLRWPHSLTGGARWPGRVPGEARGREPQLPHHADRGCAPSVAGATRGTCVPGTSQVRGTGLAGDPGHPAGQACGREPQRLLPRSRRDPSTAALESTPVRVPERRSEGAGDGRSLEVQVSPERKYGTVLGLW